jgi:hypothetical protein
MGSAVHVHGPEAVCFEFNFKALNHTDQAICIADKTWQQVSTGQQQWRWMMLIEVPKPQLHMVCLCNAVTDKPCAGV